MKSIFNVSIILMSIFMIYSCTDLEEDLQGDFTEDFDPDNPNVGAGNNVNQPVPTDGLAAAFSGLFAGSANHGSYFSVGEVSTDEVVITQKGGDWFDGGIWLNMHRHEWQSTNPGLLGAWNDTYLGIAECNRLLAVSDISSDAGRVAQLRTLRAYYYWRLLDTFGRVKIVTVLGEDSPQVDRPEVYAFVESELLAAIPDLPEGRAEYGRVSRPGAYALLSRLYLNAGVYTGTPEWQKAIDAADEVINSGVYDLSETYAAVFAPDNVDNIEHIWVIPFDEATGTGMNLAQMTLHYPSQLTYRLQQQPWNGYSTLEEFYNSYSDQDVRKENNFIVGPQFDQFGNPILDVAFDKADEDGAPVVYTPQINELAPNGSRQAGARLGKFSFKQGQLNDMDNDFPIFRYAEILLNKAEAVARLNGNNFAGGETLTLINMLRNRASVPEFTTLTEEEFLAERGREVFQEILRRTDLIRFNAWGDEWWEKPAHSNPNLNIFPIPNDQILASQSEQFPLTQNPGYN